MLLFTFDWIAVSMKSIEVETKALTRRGVLYWSSFQMTAESNYVIAIATRSDWLKRVAPIFKPMRSKNKTNSHLVRVIFLRFERVTGNC